MLKGWQRYLYFSQWLIAVGAAAQCWQTGLWLQLPASNFWLYAFVFSSTLLLYLFHFRFFWIQKPVNDRQHFLHSFRSFMLFQFVAGSILLTISFFKIGIHFLIPVALLAACAGAYTYFILKPRHYGIFKYNGIFKILTLSFVWMAAGSILPVAAAGHPLFSLPQLFFYFNRWLFMLAICLPFDVRDVQQDQRNGSMTVPVLIGVSQTFRLCYIFLFLQALLPFAGWAAGWYQGRWVVSNLPATALTTYCIYYSSRHLKDDFSWFLLDSNFVLRTAIIGSALIF